MSAERFGDAAARLCGMAALLLGWRPDEFWRATPCELATILAAVPDADGDGAPPDPGTLANLRDRFPD